MEETIAQNTPEQTPEANATPSDQGTFEDLFNNFEVTPNQAAFGESPAEQGNATTEQVVTEQASPPAQAEDGADNPDNDTVRYQYWQSQADKMKNELQAKDNYIRSLQTKQKEPVQQPVEAQPEKGPDAGEFFPPPPAKPQLPRGYNREDLSESGSESSKYHYDLEEWRDNMVEYTRLHSQWQVAKLKESQDAFQEKAAEDARMREAYAQKQQEIDGIRQHVQANYGFSNEQTEDFLKTMSSPESISMENLVELYKMRTNGGQVAPPPVSPAQAQVNNAQQVPSPMGVQTGVNQATDQQDPANSIMDLMINQHDNAVKF